MIPSADDELLSASVSLIVILGAAENVQDFTVGRGEE